MTMYIYTDSNTGQAVVSSNAPTIQDSVNITLTLPSVVALLLVAQQINALQSFPLPQNIVIVVSIG